MGVNLQAFSSYDSLVRYVNVSLMIQLVGNSLGEGAYFSLDGHITFIFAGLFSIISYSILLFQLPGWLG